MKAYRNSETEPPAKPLAPEDLWIESAVPDAKTGFPMPTKGRTDMSSQGEERGWPTNHDYEGMDQVLINKGIAKIVDKLVKDEHWTIKNTDTERCGDKPECGDLWLLENLDGDSIDVNTAPSPVFVRVSVGWSG